MDGESLKSINIQGKRTIGLGNRAISNSKDLVTHSTDLHSKDLITQTTLKRSLTLTDLPNAHSISNPFKISKPDTGHSFKAGKTGEIGSSRLKRSNSLNPFSLKNPKSESRLSVDNPFNILGGQSGELKENLGGLPGETANQPTTLENTILENPIILKRKRVRLEKENIPPDILADYQKEESILKTSTAAENASESESDDCVDKKEELGLTSSSKTSLSKGSLKIKQFIVERDLLPIDWSLKKSFTITSNFSLDWISVLMNAKNLKVNFSAYLISAVFPE